MDSENLEPLPYWYDPRRAELAQAFRRHHHYAHIHNWTHELSTPIRWLMGLPSATKWALLGLICCADGFVDAKAQLPLIAIPGAIFAILVIAAVTSTNVLQKHEQAIISGVYGPAAMFSYEPAWTILAAKLAGWQIDLSTLLRREDLAEEIAIILTIYLDRIAVQRRALLTHQDDDVAKMAIAQEANMAVSALILLATPSFSTID